MEFTQEQFKTLKEYAENSTAGFNVDNLLWLEYNPKGGVCPMCDYGSSNSTLKNHAPVCLLVETVKLLHSLREF